MERDRKKKLFWFGALVSLSETPLCHEASLAAYIFLSLLMIQEKLCLWFKIGILHLENIMVSHGRINKILNINLRFWCWVSNSRPVELSWTATWGMLYQILSKVTSLEATYQISRSFLLSPKRLYAFFFFTYATAIPKTCKHTLMWNIYL